MNIEDKNGNLLASIIKKDDMKGDKYFATADEQDLQIAKFDLEKDTEILRHIHLKQERKIMTTSEVIILTDGEMIVDIYSEELELLHSEALFEGDILANKIGCAVAGSTSILMSKANINLPLETL